MKTKFAKLLIAVGILLALLFLGRGLYFAPNDDSGLAVESAVISSTTVGSTSIANYPARLEIPKLDIDTEVQHVGVTKTGNMAAPNNFTDVSWYKFGTIPGHTGSAVMAGHEDNAISLDGVFKHLEDLEVGDDVYVIDHNNKKLHFKVIAEEIYPYNKSPLERIFNKSDGTYFNLITCAGDWLASAKTNDKRLVVYTKLVD
ncbi:MAG: class F sortase [bacterium]|nr:class F sortase [bacterium]